MRPVMLVPTRLTRIVAGEAAVAANVAVALPFASVVLLGLVSVPAASIFQVTEMDGTPLPYWSTNRAVIRSGFPTTGFRSAAVMTHRTGTSGCTVTFSAS